MSGFSDLAASMLVSAQQRLEITALNVSNLSTPGYLSRKAFQRVMDVRQTAPTISVVRPDNPKASALKATGNPLDLAVTGGGVLLVRSGGALVPIIAGQFSRDGDGRLVDANGRVLQAFGGGDLKLSSDNPVVLQDGTVLVDGQPEARVGAFVASAEGFDGRDPNLGNLPDAAEEAVLHQGMTVPSNVDLASEMVEITKAAQMAQTGARLFQIYDDLIGRVASKAAEAGR